MTISGDNVRLPISSQPSMNSANSLAVSRTAVPSSRHSDAKRPRASRL